MAEPAEFERQRTNVEIQAIVREIYPGGDREGAGPAKAGPAPASN